MRICRSPQCTVALPGCSCRIFTFGKVQNGSVECTLWRTISEGFGSRLAITIMAIPGRNKDMTVIETVAEPVRRLEWQFADVREIATETYRVRRLLLLARGWHGHLPGQHLDIRLTAEGGY